MNPLITDRAEALLLGCDEPEYVVFKTVPIAKAPPAPSHEPGDGMTCPWCGTLSAPGAGCDSCGSPLS